MNIFYKKLFKFSVILLVLCIVSLFIFQRTERINRFKSAIPEKIKVNGVVLQGEDITPLIFAFIFPIDSCGGGIFKLSKSTLKNIELEGLSFFEDATKSRSRKHHPRTWNWKKTPVPSTWTSEGAWIGLACISSSNTNKLIRKITKTVESPGSYYAGSPNSTLLVLPKLGLVVYDYSD